jgi:hypothetical protein
VKLRVRDICHGDRDTSRATVLQQKTQQPVQFEISPDTAAGSGSLDSHGRPDAR